MDKNVQNKIASIIAEINEIASELEDISHDLGREFKGIGVNEECLKLAAGCK